MGELIRLTEFFASEAHMNSPKLPPQRDRRWYLPHIIETPDERGNKRRNWHLTILQYYPEMTAIGSDHFIDDDYKSGDATLWRQIRLFARDRCSGDVIVRNERRDYAYVRQYTDTNGKPRAYRTKIDHSYEVFYFETAADAVSFALVFSMAGEMTDRHPNSSATEEEIEFARKNPYGSYLER